MDLRLDVLVGTAAGERIEAEADADRLPPPNAITLIGDPAGWEALPRVGVRDAPRNAAGEERDLLLISEDA